MDGEVGILFHHSQQLNMSNEWINQFHPKKKKSACWTNELFVLQTDEMDSAQLKEKIEVAIAELDVPKSPISYVTYQQEGFDEAIFLQ